jgi:GNAT superfamily N-acetyltransferase
LQTDNQEVSIIRVTENWQRAGVHYVRVQGMLRVFAPIELYMEFHEDTPETEYILALVGKVPAGTCRLDPISADTAKIERVSVIPEFQGLKIGRQVMEEAEKWLREKGIRHIVITARDAAVGFYEKLGYVANYDQVEVNEVFRLIYMYKEI